MNKLLKWSLIASGTAAVLILLAVLIIPRFVDVNRYRPQIEQQVTRITGRPFVLGGELDLSIFPWMGLTLSDLSLGNPEGFDQKEFITIKRFEVRVKVLPLFSRTIQVKKFVVDTPEIFLVKSRAGDTNWDMGQTQPSTPKKQPAGTVDHGRKPANTLPVKALFVDEFSIRNGRIHYSDPGLKVKKEISSISLTLGNLNLEDPIKVAFSALADGRPLSLNGLVGPIGKNPGMGTIPLDITLKALDDITLGVKGAVMDPIKTPGFDLDLDLSPFSPRKLLTTLGNSAPLLTADPKVLEHLQLKFHLKGDATAVRVSNGTLTLDDSTLTFSARASDLSKPDLDVDMAVDTINLDRYLPPKKSPTPPAETVKSPPESPAAVRAGIDYAPLRKLAIDVTLKIKSLVAQKAQLQAVQMTLRGKNGRFNLDPLSLDLYQGTIVSRADLDVTTDTPRINLTVDAEKIASGALIADVLEKKIIQGQVTATMGITLAGDTPEAIKKSLNGRGNLKFTDGAIIGIDIPGMVRNLKASFGRGEQPATPPRTDFAELMLPFTITSGRVDATGATLSSPLLRVMAKGTADLVTETLNMRVEPKFVSTLTGQGDTQERSGLTVPVLITGTLDKPIFSPDLKSMVQSIVPDQEALKSLIKDGKIDKEAIQKTGENIKQLFKGFQPFKGTQE